MPSDESKFPPVPELNHEFDETLEPFVKMGEHLRALFDAARIDEGKIASVSSSPALASVVESMTVMERAIRRGAPKARPITPRETPRIPERAPIVGRAGEKRPGANHHEQRLETETRVGGAGKNWQIPLGKQVDKYYAELKVIQKLYPAGTNESGLEKEHSIEFEILEKMKDWKTSERKRFFARLHLMKAPEMFGFIALCFNRQGDTVDGWRKVYRKSLNRRD
jgi:hypothetical protein